MADNQIVISDQSPQTLGVNPKPGEKLWFVVTDNGANYKITKVAIANSDVWSDAIDFTAGSGGGGSGTGITDGDKGDITVSNTGGTWTIDNKAVTLTKLADMATGKLLGRSTATAGSPEVIDIDSSLALAAGTLSTNAKIKAVGALSTAGLIKSTGANTASIVTTSATIDNLLGAADQAAARSAINLGQIKFDGATPTPNITGIDSAVDELMLRASGGGFNGLIPSFSVFAGTIGGAGLLGGLVRCSVDVAGFGINLPSGTFQMRAEYRPSFTWDGSSRQLQFFDGDGDNTPAKRFVGIGKNSAQIYTDLSVESPTVGVTNKTVIGRGTIRLNGGATQTASLRGTKTIGAPSTADTITVTGAAVGDIARVSRGKDAYVSAPNTVTFDSTGLAGIVVTAIVERFT